MPRRQLRVLLWGVAAAAGLAYLGLIFWTNNRIHGDVGGTSADPASEAIVPRFTLTDHTGSPVTEASYRGCWLLVFFGFTNCPDICPTTLAELADVVDGLGAAGSHVQPIFISVDAARYAGRPRGVRCRLPSGHRRPDPARRKTLPPRQQASALTSSGSNSRAAQADIQADILKAERATSAAC